MNQEGDEFGNLFEDDPDFQLQEKEIKLITKNNNELMLKLLCAQDSLQMVSSRAYLRVWPASVALATFLLNEKQEILKQKQNYLELGCGTGFCSLALINDFQNQVENQDKINFSITDGDLEVMKLVEQNLKLQKNQNSNLNIFTHQLFWGDSESQENLFKKTNISKYDLIYGSDVTYKAENIDPLFKTASLMLEKNNLNKSLFILCYSFPRFGQMEKFIQESAQKYNFSIKYSQQFQYLDPNSQQLTSQGIKIAIFEFKD